MDANDSNFLVVLPPTQGTIVPLAADVVVLDAEPEPDLLAQLWRRFCKLSFFCFLLLTFCRQLRRQLAELRQQAGYWQAQHQRAVLREAELAEKVQLLEGELRELKRRFFGRKSETSASTTTTPTTTTTSNNPNTKPRNRGQQPNAKGHGRRNFDHLTTVDENCALPKDQQCCAECRQPYVEIPGSADGDILEIEVRAHRRRYHRQRYRRTCNCASQPAVVTAPPPDKLIPKSNIGISLWVLILQRKFQFFLPLHRVLAELRGHDLNLAAGTITGGLQKITPLFQPLYELLVEHNRTEEHWHCDETRWLVFVKQTDKAGFNWMLWVFAGEKSVVFVLDPTRSHDVPEKHFGDDAEGIINVDRYSAYKAMAQVKAGDLVLAFCWAHVRRDFLAVLTGWAELNEWALQWVEEIGTLYQRNNHRLAVQEDAAAYVVADRSVRDQVEQMRQRCENELAEPKLRTPQRKALTSLQNHWAGLTVFVDNPEVPMDNNEAERRLRGPVVARKNYYGSGALWSGRLAAMMFSLFQTIQLWGMDTGKWLTAYLSACAKAGGEAPPDPQNYLPWNMTAEQRDEMSVTKPKPPDPKPSDAGTE